MHHYGEDAVQVHVFQDHFVIEIRNHDTGAVITVSGPAHGVLEATHRSVGSDEAHSIGYELAHMLRELTSTQRFG